MFFKFLFPVILLCKRGKNWILRKVRWILSLRTRKTCGTNMLQNKREVFCVAHSSNAIDGQMTDPYCQPPTHVSWICFDTMERVCIFMSLSHRLWALKIETHTSLLPSTLLFDTYPVFLLSLTSHSYSFIKYKQLCNVISNSHISATHAFFLLTPNSNIAQWSLEWGTKAKLRDLIQREPEKVKCQKISNYRGAEKDMNGQQSKSDYIKFLSGFVYLRARKPLSSLFFLVLPMINLLLLHAKNSQICFLTRSVVYYDLYK